MIPPAELLSHLWAWALVWALVILPGAAMARLLPAPLRNRESWAAWPMLGAAYWAAAVYLLPIPYALPAALVLVVAMAALAILRPNRPRGAANRRRHPLAGMILAAGCLSYATPLFVQHVPHGMDASRYAAGAPLVAANAYRLPRTLDPLVPGVPFGASNHGATVLAAMTLPLGAASWEAVIAESHLAFACLVLGSYLLLRLFSRRLTSACVAVASAWFTRNSQYTLGWGGWTNMLCLGMALLATRAIIDSWRRGGLRGAAPLGLLIGALPLIQGTVAAGWLYVAVPAAALTGALCSRRRRAGLAACLAGAAVAAVVLGAYVLTAHPTLTADAKAWIHDWQRLHGPDGEGWSLVAAVAPYVARATDENLFYLGAAALAFLLARGRWRPAALLLLATATVAAIIVNHESWLLPGSPLLYPERALYWTPVIAGACVALAWRALPARVRSDRRVMLACAAVLFAWSFARHMEYYQKVAREKVISEPAWRALLWARENLRGRGAVVADAYNTAGAYLPAVAEVAATQYHLHVDQICPRQPLPPPRTPTHVFYMDPWATNQKSLKPWQYEPDRQKLAELIARRAGRVVFDAGGVRIYELPQP